MARSFLLQLVLHLIRNQLLVILAHKLQYVVSNTFDSILELLGGRHVL